jgi:hypothetical protein
MRNGLEIVHSRSGHGFYRQPFLAKQFQSLFFACVQIIHTFIDLIEIGEILWLYPCRMCKEKQLW